MTMIPTTRAASIPSRRVTISASNMPPCSPRRPGPADLRPNPGRALEDARPAVPADLVRMAGHQETLLAAHLLLDPLHLAAFELEDRSAGEADHVIVVVPPDHRLVAGLAVGHLDLVNQARIDQVRQAAVQRGPGDRSPRPAQPRQEIVDVEMAAGRQDLVQDEPPLAGHPEPVGGEVRPETARRSAHGPSALLQHRLNYRTGRGALSNAARPRADTGNGEGDAVEAGARGPVVQFRPSAPPLMAGG